MRGPLVLFITSLLKLNRRKDSSHEDPEAMKTVDEASVMNKGKLHSTAFIQACNSTKKTLTLCLQEDIFVRSALVVPTA